MPKVSRIPRMNPLRISGFQHEKTGTTSRVSTDIDGASLWFESDDVDLEPSVEALASIWLIPALLSKRSLKIDEPLCKTWLANAHKVMEFLDESWGANPIEIDANPVEKSIPVGQARGLFFSGGVDSFYTLLSIEKPDFLIYVESFDVPSDEENRARIARERLCRVASAIGSKPITIRTNLKKHPTFKKPRFADTHAALLGAVGHLLAPHLGSVIIAPSWHKGHHAVYGSHWQMDPLWSSGRVKIIHGDNTQKRRARVFAIAGEKLVQENLQVCFENANCSRCAKCIRTMVELHQAKQLPKFKVFDQSVPIWEAIDQVPKINPGGTSTYENILENNPEPELASAIKRLFRRSSLAATALEDQLKERRYVDDQFPKIEEGLKNAMQQYSLLQEEHKNLAADYEEVVGKLPVKRGIRAVRKVLRTLRGGRAGKVQSHE